MNIIENLNPTEFTNYIKKYGNTICGRHPIGILLQVLQKISTIFIDFIINFDQCRLFKNCCATIAAKTQV